MRRHLWILLGLVSLGLGLVGAVVPLLPTTVFMIFAAFAFGKGSPRLRAWIETHPRFGPPVRRWQRERAIAPRHKRAAAIAMAAGFGLSLALRVPGWVLAVQALCLIGAAAFVLTRPDGSG